MDSLKILIHSLEGTEINNIHIDINRNLIQISTQSSEHESHSITFDSILRLNYLPDFTDPGTLLIIDIEYDFDIVENLAKKHLTLWPEGSPALAKFNFEQAHRIRMLSADFELEVYCLNIIENTHD
ncbi:hypothetical protein [Owenweeksia hongkongensis]|uniref:Uncharacterized protein n=1 Tax=Owenweeksia hongkongensis (strain DSM 17368 / CIP 108786 / JCM 12287 / NRRL B-23963 / UST20020801) TaxID=926562 RepID=G8QZZ0_OWEHD|nr:hypothetical protein [Owenweeksia hongkongensis]AEV32630.1 hypothetical protein Oweho_1642 [Owenweeksia hongkongensis DSM 17368]